MIITNHDKNELALCFWDQQIWGGIMLYLAFISPGNNSEPPHLLEQSHGDY